MTHAFRHIAEHCRPGVYYHTPRPYLFGFDTERLPASVPRDVAPLVLHPFASSERSYDLDLIPAHRRLSLKRAQDRQHGLVMKHAAFGALDGVARCPDVHRRLEPQVRIGPTSRVSHWISPLL